MHKPDCALNDGDPCSCGAPRPGLDTPAPAPSRAPESEAAEAAAEAALAEHAADAAALAEPPASRLELVDRLSQAERERDAAREYNKKLADEKKALAQENVVLMEKNRELMGKVAEYEQVVTRLNARLVALEPVRRPGDA